MSEYKQVSIFIVLLVTSPVWLGIISLFLKGLWEKTEVKKVEAKKKK